MADDALRIADKYLGDDDVTTQDANAYTAQHPRTISDILDEVKRQHPEIPEVGEAGIRGMMPGWSGWAQTAGETFGKALNSIPPEVAFAANFLTPGVKAPVRISNPIRAYHGSPHDFNEFSLDKIGTGEGAQAYGHGLYFAESEPAARWYRDQLTGETAPFYNGVPSAHSWETADLTWLNPKILREQGGKPAIDDAIQRLNDQAQFYGKVYGQGEPNPNDNLYSRAAARLAKLDPEKIAAPGRMYEVALHATPEQFLDWDKPLSGQPVLSKLESMFPPDVLARSRYRENVLKGSGADFMDTLRVHAPDFAPGGDDAPGMVAVANKLREAGIPGIRYLDQGSRLTPAQTAAKMAKEGYDYKPPTHNYVVWDPSVIEILRKYGMAGLALLPPAVAASIRPSDDALRIADKHSDQD